MHEPPELVYSVQTGAALNPEPYRVYYSPCVQARAAALLTSLGAVANAVTIS